MKKATKKRLMSLFIILIMTFSTIGFVVGSFGQSHVDEQSQFQPLKNFVVDGELELNIENEYIRRGYTVLKYYYTTEPPAFLDAFPQAFKTNNNQLQLIVEKIQSDSEQAVIISQSGEITVNTTQLAIVDAVCDNLVAPTLECGLRSIIKGNEIMPSEDSESAGEDNLSVNIIRNTTKDFESITQDNSTKNTTENLTG